MQYAIRGKGFRHAPCKERNASFIANSKTVVFIGDSFTFSDGLNYSETLTAFLCKIYKASSVNRGISGYGTNHALYTTQEHLNKRTESGR